MLPLGVTILAQKNLLIFASRDTIFIKCRGDDK